MKSKQLVKVNGRVIRMALASALAFGCGTSGVNSYAGSQTSNMAVSASVAANCTISAGALNFSAYDPIVTNASAALDGTATVTVTCTSGASTTVTLGQGANADSGSTAAAPLRRMLSGSNYLSYALYQNAGRTTVWGDTAGTGVGHTGTGTATGITVYGRVAGGQNVPAGAYSDTVVATVTF
jgi:spore coat protein U-like protein